MLNNQLNQLMFGFNNTDSYQSFSPYLAIGDRPKNVDFGLIIETLDLMFLERYDRSLSTVEELLLAGIWQRKTYSEIAKEHNYSADYFSNVAAPKLLKQLSQLLQCRVTKKNCQSALTTYVANEKAETLVPNINKVDSEQYVCRVEQNFTQSSFLQDAILLAQMI